jgi:hypothetical protein
MYEKLLSVTMLLFLSLSILLSSCGENSPPFVDELIIPETIGTSSEAEVMVMAHDADGDTLIYTWQVNGITLADTTPTIIWEPPMSAQELSVEVCVSVSDGENDPVIHRGYMKVVPTDAIMIKDVLERFVIGYTTEDLELYMSVFWAEGYYYYSDMATPNDPSDDVIFDSWVEERYSAIRVFRNWDIQLDFSEPEIVFESKTEAVVHNHYRILFLGPEDMWLPGGYEAYYAEGDNEFIFEKRSGESPDVEAEWRIVKWFQYEWPEEKIREVWPLEDIWVTAHAAAISCGALRSIK